MKDTGKINETDVEMCVELARQWDEEDMTHPPFRRVADEEDKEDSDDE